ncbi:MAG: energy transducer TonB [Cytophagales bacterium]|nr:MAG: energy transducer TonB [Cytophagales bacterium]
MIHRNISQLALDEVVFEYKNQMYGAYELRQVYNSHLVRSVVFMLLFVSAVGTGFVALNFAKTGELFTKLLPKLIEDEVIIDLIDIPKLMVQLPQPVVPIAPQNSVSPPISALNNTNFRAVETPIESPTIDFPLIDAGKSDGNVVPIISSGNGTLGTPSDILPSEAIENSIVDYVPIMPQFKNLSAYLSANISYPNDMLNLGITGKVYIEFVVLKDGKVSDAKIYKSSGHSSLDAEALRVVAQMPNWSPGLNNGNPVAVRQKQCINFRIQE